jgi:integrase/recombinase XerD
METVSPYKSTIRRRFEDVTGEYLASAKSNLKPATHRRYKTSILKLAETFAGRWWDAITKETLLEYIDERKGEGVKISTIKRDLTALSQAADYAVDRAWAGTNPVSQLPRRPLRYKAPVFRRPSLRSVELGITCCHGNLQPLARFLLATGMRLMEGASLTRPQIDKRRKVATLSDTKNGRARTVSLNATAMGIIAGQEGEILFPAIDRVTGEARVYKQASTNWATAQARAAKKAKEQGWKFERFRLHDLRHMFAIDYLANGGNIYQLQIELGHGSLKQTEWYLQFLSPDEQMKAKFTPAQMPSHAKRFSVAESGKPE